MEKLKVKLTHRTKPNFVKYGTLLSTEYENSHNQIWAIAIVIMDSTNLITAFSEYEWQIQAIE